MENEKDFEVRNFMSAIRPIPREALPANLFEPYPSPEYGLDSDLGSPTIYPDFPDEYVIELSHDDYMKLHMILTRLDEEDLLAVINDQAIEQFVEYRRYITQIGGVFESEVQSSK